ncbi:MAG: ABC transporter substrate-binding protein, partial [bacterium]
MKRLWLMSTVLLTLGLVMLGCVAPAPPAQAPAPEEEAPKAPEEAKAKITWSFWGSPDEVAAHEDALEAFRKAHPEIEVEIMHIEWADYFTKMETLFAAGKPEDIPDVMFVGGPWTQKWASLGVLEPLNSFIERDNVDLDDYWPKLLAYGSIGDQIYGLSRDVPPNVLYYNKAIFQEAGVDFPDETWTWEGFLAAAEKLTVKDASGRVSRYALGMEQGKYWYWLAQAGGSIVDDAEHNFSNPSQCMLDSPESQRGIEFMNT